MPLIDFIKTNYEKLQSDSGDGSGSRFFVGYKGKIAESKVTAIKEKYIQPEKHLFTQKELDRKTIQEFGAIFSDLKNEIKTVVESAEIKLNEKSLSALTRAYYFAFITQFNILASSDENLTKGFEYLTVMKLMHKFAELGNENVDSDRYISNLQAEFSKLQRLYYPSHRKKSEHEVKPEAISKRKSSKTTAKPSNTKEEETKEKIKEKTKAESKSDSAKGRELTKSRSGSFHYEKPSKLDVFRDWLRKDQKDKNSDEQEERRSRKSRFSMTTHN